MNNKGLGVLEILTIIAGFIVGFLIGMGIYGWIGG